jgi:hypothetical protein
MSSKTGSFYLSLEQLSMFLIYHSVNLTVPFRCVLLARSVHRFSWCIASELLPVGFEVFTAVTMKNGVFLGVTPCGSCKNRRFGGT